MLTFLRNRLAPTLLLAIGALTLQVSAHADTFGGINPVSNEKLAHIRGGFAMQLDFGWMQFALDMSRASFINGNLLLADHRTDATGGALDLIQNGLSNTVDSSVGSNMVQGALAAVIQNGLDNQIIRNINVVNLTVTSQEFARSMALHSMFQGVLLQSLR